MAKTKKVVVGKGVLVTTAHKGVFFGYLVGEPSKEKVVLTQARNCVYWDAGVKGFAGLAMTGPNTRCRVGPAVPRATLFDVTSVAECTSESIAAWEAAPWAG